MKTATETASGFWTLSDGGSVGDRASAARLSAAFGYELRPLSASPPGDALNSPARPHTSPPDDFSAPTVADVRAAFGNWQGKDF